MHAYADELDFLQISCRIYSVSVKTIEINIRYVIHHCIRGLYEVQRNINVFNISNDNAGVE